MRGAIVIGARCAGATTALVLARRGLDVLLVDRAAFPSEIPHGHFIHQSGPACLAELGLLDRVLGTGSPPVTTITTDFGDGPLTGRGLVRDGVPFGLGPRRGPLDRVLGEAAGAGLTGSAPLDEALAGYGRRRDEATLPDDHRNILAAKLRDKPPDELALRAARRGRQDDINHFYRVRQAMDSRESFFNDDNLARIMAAAAA
jgi:choline dehydrogenase-like flavoprotein